MKIGFPKLLKSDDFKDAPEWFDKFLEYFNDLVGNILSSLEKRLTFADNFNCIAREDVFSDGIELGIKYNLGSKYFGIIILSSSTEIIGRTDRVLTNGNIGIKFSFTGGVGISSKVKYILIGE